MHLEEWSGDLTLYSSAYNPLPGRECPGFTFSEVEQVIAPGNRPRIEEQKKDSLHFTSCLLKKAPYVGKTRERAEKYGWQPAGKQRSGVHVTDSTMIVLDIDGASETQFAQIQKQLKSNGLSFIAYSSYSNGDPKKPGIRCRLVVPVDRALNKHEYKLAAAGLTQFLGLGHD